MINNYSTTKLVQNKLRLLNLAAELNNISKAYKMMGVSRDTFYRYQDAKENGGIDALLDKSRKVPNHKNRVDATIEEVVKSIAYEQTGLEPDKGV